MQCCKLKTRLVAPQQPLWPVPAFALGSSGLLAGTNMLSLNKLQSTLGRKAPHADQTAGNTDIQMVADDERGPHDEDLDKGNDDAVPNRDAQLGIRKIEAVTLAWTKPWLAALLIKYGSPSLCARFDTELTLIAQYLDHLPDQWVQACDPRQLDALCHEQLPVAFASDSYWHCL